MDSSRTGHMLKPTETIPVIVSEMGNRRLEQYFWGIFPFWAKDSINARSETIRDHRAYKRIFAKQRCVIPCDGFYVTKTIGKAAKPVRVTLRDRELFALAGLYDVWMSPGGSEFRSCTILTTSANQALEPYQERMPVVLDNERLDQWLNPRVSDSDMLVTMMKPWASDRAIVHDTAADWGTYPTDDGEKETAPFPMFHW